MPSTSAKTRWFTELLDAAALDANSVGSKAAELKTLDAWFSQTLESLNDAELEFSPSLPDEELPVAERIRALSDFCGGYTYGVGIAMSQRGQKPLPTDTREIIEDFQAIEAVDPEFHDQEEVAIDTSAAPRGLAIRTDGDIKEQQEAMYTELLEYVRVGVLLVMEELRPVTIINQGKPS